MVTKPINASGVRPIRAILVSFEQNTGVLSPVRHAPALGHNDLQVRVLLFVQWDNETFRCGLIQEDIRGSSHIGQQFKSGVNIGVSRMINDTPIDEKKYPDFFIAGAMKSGTTAVDTYLSEHPRIHMARPKDGNFFGEDFEPVRVVKDWDEYRRMFWHAKRDDVAATGETTAMYLHSEVAPANIYHYNPRARLIVLLRNPVDLVHSFHNQLLYNGDEDEPDFERAWELQTRRARGEALPRQCRQPGQLQYYAIGCLGAHMQRWRRYFPWDQFKIVLFEDLVQRPQRFYEEILTFIGVETDHRVMFKPANESKQHRLERLGHFSEQPPGWLQSVVKKAKRVTGIERFGVLDVVRALNRKPYIRPALRPAFRQYLTEVFEEDIQRLSGTVGKDLSHWILPTETPSTEEVE